MCGRPYPPLCEVKSRRARWTVTEKVRFLEGRDLVGPAEQARRSGMDGADLLELSKQQLCTEVLLTPLAARKVVAARDEFLCH